MTSKYKIGQQFFHTKTIYNIIISGGDAFIYDLFCFLQSSEQETKGLPSKKGIVQAVVGQGYHRKIVLASQSTQNTIYR